MLDPVHHMLDGVHHMMDRRAIIWWTPSKIWWMGSIIWWIPFFVKFAKPLVFSSPRIKEFIFKFCCEFFCLISNFVAKLFILVWIWWFGVHHKMDPVHHLMAPLSAFFKRVSKLWIYTTLLTMFGARILMFISEVGRSGRGWIGWHSKRRPLLCSELRSRNGPRLPCRII